MRLELIATATFGLEAVVRREVEELGYEVIRTEDGKVTYAADERGVVRSNLHLRCADRVLVKIDEFDAPDFETLFQRVRGISWEEWIPRDGRFVVTCTTVKSKLHNEPACQRTVKKAIVSRLQDFYVMDILPESGADYTVKLTLRKDRATLTIDTSGTGLHKRGYRVAEVAAPIKETLAAALVSLSFWREDRILLDPCCGSGTLAIEAAMMGMGIAPGLSRSFASEDWEQIPGRLWKEERRRAFDAIRTDTRLRISGSDIDRRAVEAALENAIEAGVDEAVSFRRADVNELMGSARPKEEGVILLTNLPYGIRIGQTPQLQQIYRTLRRTLEQNPTWSLFAITADKGLEEAMGRKADRRRKLYNGNIETTYYQYHGQRRREDVKAREAGSKKKEKLSADDRIL